MQRYFKVGHVIGKPAPLFTKIEASKLEELKVKYGGQQVKEEKPQANVQFSSRDEVANAVAVHAEKVRSLKASGAEKTVWKLELDILLKLKKQLEAFASK